MMKKDPTMVRLESQIELVRRQVAELKTLLLEHKKARCLAIEMTNQYPVCQEQEDARYMHSKRSIETKSTELLSHITKRAHVLTLLSIQQANEQQQMQARHQQETTTLESVLASQENDPIGSGPGRVD
jgi:hypothetical protein